MRASLTYYVLEMRIWMTEWLKLLLGISYDQNKAFSKFKVMEFSKTCDLWPAVSCELRGFRILLCSFWITYFVFNIFGTQSFRSILCRSIVHNNEESIPHIFRMIRDMTYDIASFCWSKSSFYEKKNVKVENRWNL